VYKHNGKVPSQIKEEMTFFMMDFSEFFFAIFKDTSFGKKIAVCLW
jgi:hypothetical protein